jgi:hypothetical protein
LGDGQDVFRLGAHLFWLSLVIGLRDKVLRDLKPTSGWPRDVAEFSKGFYETAKAVWTSALRKIGFIPTSSQPTIGRRLASCEVLNAKNTALRLKIKTSS